MSRTKSALVSLVILLGGTLSLAAPYGSSGDATGSSDKPCGRAETRACGEARNDTCRGTACNADPRCEPASDARAIVEARLNELFPGCQIRLVAIRNNLVVTGSVSDETDAARIVGIVKGLIARSPCEKCRTPAATIPGSSDRSEPGQPAVLDMLRLADASPQATVELEMESDEPHPAAILLIPADAECTAQQSYSTCTRSARRTCDEHCGNLAYVPSAIDWPALDIDLAPARAAVVPCIECRDGDREPCHKNSDSACCNNETRGCRTADTEEEIEMELEFDAEECEAVECFMEQVLHAHAQHLEALMQARLHHERTVLAIRAEAESRLVQIKEQHASETARIRADHAAELREMHANMMQSERRMVEIQHRQALEHERQLAEVRRQQFEAVQLQRVATLETEIHWLKRRIEAMASHGSAAAADSHSARRPEIPIQVEDLVSGRVRYSPASRHESDIASVKPLETVERIELSTPPLAAPSAPSDVDRLRREVARLRALVEDLLCIAPELIPLPKPQTNSGTHDD